MLRQNDPVLHHDDRSFWEYVEKMDDVGMWCKFCWHFFAEHTSITRIKHHLSGRKRGGAQNCAQVPQHVRDAALAAIDGPPAKKRKTVPGSSNNEVTNEISASAQQQNNEMMMAQQRGDLSLEDWMASIPVEDMELRERGRFHERPSFNQADEHRGDPSQPTHDQLCSPSVNNDATMNVAQNVVGVQVMEQGGEEERLCSHLDMDNGMENTGEGSVQHVDRIVSPWRHAIDENYSRRGATERLVQPGVGGSSSGVNVNHTAISTSPQEQNNEVYNLTGDGTSIQAPDMSEKSWEEIIHSLMDDGIQNTIGVAQPGAGASSSGVLQYNPSETRGAPLPTGSTKLVGRAFEENKNVIRSWLTDDEVSIIGIYGMGGAGKTTMLKYVYNELLQIADISHHVYWVTVSQDFSIHTLQKKIAECMKLSLSNKEEELHRAAELSLELEKKQRWILILDDLWDSFELHEVGIPVPLKGCKLIMTTRSKEVCGRMDCRNNIIVNPLSDEEAWILFREILGHDTHLSTKVEQIAKSITKECDGLPLGIKTMAGTMKVVDGIHGWSNSLERLRQSRIGLNGMERVFSSLRVSYTHVSDVALQQCFLYCALFPEDAVIDRVEMIRYLIDMGLIKGLTSRKAEFDEGHSMIDKLEKVCLLERKHDGGAVMMHDLIRDMAIQILEENSQAIVKAGAQLNELPDTEEWTEKLTTVSLMHNQIEEICSSHSVTCPKLSTLLLCDNDRLRLIAGSFFEQMRRLKVLDLSRTSIECLPDSVSDLEGLTSLLLKDCPRLSRVPSLKKLKALKRLDLSRAPLEKIPHGMECLSNLRYLRMNGCGEKRFPGGILPKLSRLQVFILEEKIFQMGYMFNERYAPVTVDGKEVGCLRKLESLECHFEDHSNYVEYLKSRDETQSLSTYKIVIGQLKEYEHWELVCNGPGSKMVVLGNLNINRDGDFPVISSNDIQQLICKCIDARSLGDVSPLKYATELKYIKILKCNSMESLVSSSWLCSAPLPQPSPSCNGIFSGLKRFNCSGCKGMKHLFPPVLLPSLVNLEEIIVEGCEKMEEIIGGARSDEEGDMGKESSIRNTEIKLPKLRELHLESLPELKSICSAKLICDSLRVINVRNCSIMEILVPSSRICLVNLEDIFVERCEKMKEIIGGARSDEEGDMGEESSIRNIEFKLPKLRQLHLKNLPELKSICSAKLICDSLQVIKVRNCSIMEILVPSSRICLVNLEDIFVEGCEKMKDIIGGARSDEKGDMGEESSTNIGFNIPKLRQLELRGLPKLKSICSAKLICESLEVIKVSDCKSMESLVPSSWFCSAALPSPCYNGGTRSDEKGVMGEESSTNIGFNIPKLRQLELKGLPELKSICSAKLFWESLEVIKVSNCKSMESLVPSSWFCSAALPSPCYNGGTRSDEKGVMGEESNTNIGFNLPKLRQLKLKGLPELKSICSAKLICESLEVIKVSDCKSMESLVPSSWFSSAALPSPCYNGGTRSDEKGVMGEESSTNIGFNLPKLRQLELRGLPELKSICSAKLICESLEVIKVSDCKSMESLVPSSWFCSAALPSPCDNGGTRSDEKGVMGEESSTNIGFNLPKLRQLELRGLPELKSISSAKLICKSLEVIKVSDCKSMESLVPSSWFCSAALPSPCDNGGTRSDEKGVMGEERSTNTGFNLSKLRHLELSGLPELRSICCEKMNCNSLELIWIVECEKLKRIPICLPLLENGQPSPPPSLKYIMLYSEEWWESVVEWKHSKAKDVLRPFVKFLNGAPWDFVEKLDAGSIKCIFCGYKFAPSTSVTRIKWHLSGVRGHGVAICSQVPEGVQNYYQSLLNGVK